jgi:hypothetical protein
MFLESGCISNVMVIVPGAIVVSSRASNLIAPCRKYARASCWLLARVCVAVSLFKTGASAVGSFIIFLYKTGLYEWEDSRLFLYKNVLLWKSNTLHSTEDERTQVDY